MRSNTPSRWAVLLLVVALCSSHVSAARVLDDKPAGAARTLAGFLNDLKCVAVTVGFTDHKYHYSGHHCVVQKNHCLVFHHADKSLTCCCKH
jgi:hypothetical protein